MKNKIKLTKDIEIYNKLLEKARKAYSKCATGAEKRRLESIFPELKESEDEKVRKDILRYFKDLNEQGYETKRWIAWLEKQGEHSDFRNKIQIGDKVTRNKDGVLVNLSQLERVAKPNEKQVEQKSEWSEDDKIKQTLVDFMQYLNKRDFFHDDLCFDIEHQVETFIELRNRENNRTMTNEKLVKEAICVGCEKEGGWYCENHRKCNNFYQCIFIADKKDELHQQSIIDLNCKLEEQQANYEELKRRYDEAVEREKIYNEKTKKEE